MEFVYAIRREDLFDLAYPHGFQGLDDEEPGDDKYIDRICEEGFFVERDYAEEDSNLKQIIPYSLVQGDGQVLQVKRLPSQGEDRLHEMLSIGIGGHINPEDAGEDMLGQAARRELEEELHLPDGYQRTHVGYLNDDSNPVGAVHFGLVYRVDARKESVEIREKENMEGSFVSVPSLHENREQHPDHYESWSRLLIDNLNQALPRTVRNE